MAGGKASEHDRQAQERQAAELQARENSDEDAAFEAAVTTWANRVRAEHGREPLQPWWATKTEAELHRRARALGLLD